MNDHTKMQTRLKTAIQSAIYDTGKVDGTDNIHLTNTDVVDALLEVVGVWASIHGFKDYPRSELAFKHALTIMGHIERYEPIMKSEKSPFNVIPRSKIN